MTSNFSTRRGSEWHELLADFAAAALAGLLAQQRLFEHNASDQKWAAERAFGYADAMLVEFEKRVGEEPRGPEKTGKIHPT